MLKADSCGHNSLRSDKCPQLSNAFSCEPRGSQLPESGGPCPESHRRCVLAGVRDEGKVVVGERRWRKLDDARGPLGAAASRGCGSRIVKL